jgi:hypothetical protein
MLVLVERHGAASRCKRRRGHGNEFTVRLPTHAV